MDEVHRRRVEPDQAAARIEPDVSIVIVSYNVVRHLTACLRSLHAACEDLLMEIIVIDNGSHDGSARAVASDFPQVRLVASPQNLGFAKATNLGLALARGRYVLLLNPDTVVPPSAVRSLVSIADETPEAGLVAPELRDPVTGLTQGSFRRFPSWRSAFFDYTPVKPLLRLLPERPFNVVSDEPTAAGWLSGACLLVRRQVLDAVGPLDPGYFMFCEDVEYCRRVIRAGWKLLYTRKVKVFHLGGRSTEQEPAGEMRMHAARSLLHYLSDGSLRSKILARAFVLLLLAGLPWRLLTVALKLVVYRLIGDAGRAGKYQRRLGRDALLLWKLATRRLDVRW
jgi:hypothetical protein